MARKRGRPRGAPAILIRAALWAGLVVCGAALAFVGGYLYRESKARPVEEPTRRDSRPDVEAILGRLNLLGTRVEAPDRPAAEALLERLQKVAERSRGNVSLSGVTRSPRGIRGALTVDSRTYALEIEWRPSAEPLPPRLAIIIDDMGQDLERAREFFDLRVPITAAILPHLPESRRVALLAKERGREILIHLPMQPQGYPDVNPGAGALLASMDEPGVRKALVEALENVPGAAGVNNHMGSRLTRMEAPMRWLMAELKARNLYFVDSVTTANSVAPAVAAETGVSFIRRDVFLDNDQEEGAVGAQIDKAIHQAKQAGRAVAIGHPHRVTLRALEVWATKIREAGVRVVSPSELVQRRNGA